MSRLRWLRERAGHDLAAQSELVWRGLLYGLLLAGALMWLGRWMAGSW